jgi:thiol-disulfide isomerase/thioredoxin
MRLFFIAFTALILATSCVNGQTAVTPVTPAPPSPVSGIRNKISAGDLLSAESILEVHRTKYGEDGPWLVGLSWLARGALLLRDTAKAREYAAMTIALCNEKIANGTSLERDNNLEYAFGSAIEVEAQRMEHKNGSTQAAEYLRSKLAQVKGPVSLISRLNKRLNILTLTGKPAPELTVEDFIGTQPPSLTSLRGKPVVLFVWAEGCGDCKAQSEPLGRAISRYREKDVQLVTLTRYYDADSLRSTEKARVDSVWKAVYSGTGKVPMVISTASMERYGGSSTPTFVFIDRAGIVRKYTPTRLTEEELVRSIEMLLQ